MIAHTEGRQEEQSHARERETTKAGGSLAPRVPAQSLAPHAGKTFTLRDQPGRTDRRSNTCPPDRNSISSLRPAARLDAEKLRVRHFQRQRDFPGKERT